MSVDTLLWAPQVLLAAALEGVCDERVAVAVTPPPVYDLTEGQSDPPTQSDPSSQSEHLEQLPPGRLRGLGSLESAPTAGSGAADRSSDRRVSGSLKTFKWEFKIVDRGSVSPTSAATSEGQGTPTPPGQETPART
eukprot:5618125-Pyramimonas_sp.AAC.1